MTSVHTLVLPPRLFAGSRAFNSAFRSAVKRLRSVMPPYLLAFERGTGHLLVSRESSGESTLARFDYVFFSLKILGRPHQLPRLNWIPYTQLPARLTPCNRESSGRSALEYGFDARIAEISEPDVANSRLNEEKRQPTTTV